MPAAPFGEPSRPSAVPLIPRPLARPLLALWVLGAVVLGAAAPSPFTGVGDIAHSFIPWMRLVVLGGVQAAYSGAYPDGYALYGPVVLYSYQAAGWPYALLADPTFDLTHALRTSHLWAWLVRAVKAAAVAWHLLLGLALYRLVRLEAPRTIAWTAAALYLANPAAAFDVAYWGQPDAAHGLFVVLAVGLLARGRAEWAWAAFALAALSKPQAWAVLPFLLVATWRDVGWRHLARALAAFAATAAVVLLPFATSGRLADVLTLPGAIASVMPVVSANAHNAWWLLLWLQGADAAFVLDSSPLLGPLSYRAVAGLLVIGQVAIVGWLYWRRRLGLAEACALSYLGWFLFTTQAHENHLFVALPLLLLALALAPREPRLIWPFVALTLTLLTNMLLHDLTLPRLVGADLGLDAPFLALPRAANSVAHLVVWAVWLGWRARPAAMDQAAAARYSPRSRTHASTAGGVR